MTDEEVDIVDWLEERAVANSQYSSNLRHKYDTYAIRYLWPKRFREAAQLIRELRAKVDAADS